MTDSNAALDAHLDATHDARLESYKDVPADPEHLGAARAHAADCRRAAEWLADALRTAGHRARRGLRDGGHPVVYGDWLHAEGAPTVLVYGHYDVQPVDPLDLWTSPPFEPVVDGDRMLGPRRRGRQGPDPHPPDGRRGHPGDPRRASRSTCKLRVRGRGGIELDPPRRVAARPTGTGSAADVAVISDTGFFEGNIPAITVEPARADVRPDRRRRAARSTCTPAAYGGATSRTRPTPSPRSSPRSRARTAGSAIPGFYDEVVPLTDAERAALAAPAVRRGGVPRRRSASPALVGEVGYTTLERRGARPTLDVNGIWGGFQGEGAKTIIPAHAHAKVSCRLVAAQDPDRHLRAVRDLRRWRSRRPA